MVRKGSTLQGKEGRDRSRRKEPFHCPAGLAPVSAEEKGGSEKKASDHCGPGVVSPN